MVGKHNHKFCTAVKRALADFGIVPIAVTNMTSALPCCNNGLSMFLEINYE